MATAGFERGLMLRSPARFQDTARRLVELARENAADIDDGIRDEVTRCWIGAEAYTLETFRTVSRLLAGGKIGAESSLNKIFWSELDLRMHELALEILGDRGDLLPEAPAAKGVGSWLDGYLFALSGPILRRHQRDPTQHHFRAHPGNAEVAMDFRFDDDQELLQTTVRDFLEGEITPEVVRGLWETETARSRDLWKTLAEIGLPGMLVPEEHGGMGMDEVDFVLLLEETGRAGLAEPIVATAAVAVPMLVEIGGDLAAEWLPKIAAGEAVVAVGHPDLVFVEDAHVADLLLLPDSDGAVHAVLPGDAEITEQKANDPSRRIASVSFTPNDATRLAEGAEVAQLWEKAFDRGALACAAQALGACDRMIQIAVEYTSERKQFGKPIGSFQAVKHHLAGVKVKLEYARPVVQRAAHSVANASPQRGVHVSMAKLVACEAATEGAKQTLQCHGAIGYTWEQDLHVWMRRAWSLDRAWGRSPHHLGRVRSALFDGSLPIGSGSTFLDS